MKQTVVAIGLIVSLAVLAGCSVEAVGPGSPTSAATPSRGPTEAPSSARASAAVSTSAAGDSSTRRSSYTDDVDVTMGCPSGELVLEKAGTTTRITQDCNKVTVRGALSVVLAEHVGTLIVQSGGSGSVVLVRSADSVLVDGSLAEVYWDKGSPGTVKVTGGGSSANPNPTPEG